LAAALEPALDDADAVLDRIAASMNEHDAVTAVRRRAEMMTTRVRPRADERAVPDARRKSWINEKDSERSTSISKKFGAGRALTSKTAPSRPPIAAIAGR
jgi:hypothetical protein